MVAWKSGNINKHYKAVSISGISIYNNAQDPSDYIFTHSSSKSGEAVTCVII